jgi:GNAT superfamily N-acetyltransferase
MASIDGLAFRALSRDDLPQALALSTEAGWNQTAEDWRVMLEYGRGLAAVAPDGSVIGSAFMLPYGERFAWIAMVLVTADWRRRGVATELSRRVVEMTRADGRVALLDATEVGCRVYRPIGFGDVGAMTRWQAAPPSVPPGPTTGVRPIDRGGDLDRIAAYDRAALGADRRWLLVHLIAHRPDAAFIAEAGGAVRGFVLARDGRVAHHVGPLVADDTATAEALVARALAGVDAPTLIDATDRQAGFRVWLTAAGFRPVRSFVRMRLGSDGRLDDPAGVYATTGPEFG